jgi:hypothetical protein
MKNRFHRALLALGLLALGSGVGVWAQNRLYYFNGVPYVFPASQGGAGTTLTNDGSGNLTWANPPSQGLWSGAVVLSSGSCPAGWTRLAAADNRVLRGAATAGGTGGSDTHAHAISGTSAGQAVTITGSTGSSSVSISGSTGTTSISHSHGTSPSTVSCAGGSTAVLVNVTVQSADPSHSHGAGTLSGGSHSHGVGSLAGASHTHGAGSLAAASASNVPAYYEVILCVKD